MVRQAPIRAKVNHLQRAETGKREKLKAHNVFKITLSQIKFCEMRQNNALQPVDHIRCDASRDCEGFEIGESVQDRAQTMITRMKLEAGHSSGVVLFEQGEQGLLGVDAPGEGCGLAKQSALALIVGPIVMIEVGAGTVQRQRW